MNTATIEQCETQATCAWCKHDFATILDLLNHADDGHLQVRPTAA